MSTGKDTRTEDRINRLKQINLFESLNEERLATLLEHTTTKYAKKGESIIREGEIGDSLYLLQSGSVRIKKRTLQEEDYTVVILHDHMHIYFGEVALVDNDKRSATVIAESDCELIALQRKEFLEMAEKDPLLGYRILTQIARKISGSLRKMNSDVITLFEALVTEVEGTGLTI